MKYLNPFDSFLLESATETSIESPQIKKASTIDDYFDAKNLKDDSGDPSFKKYQTACQNFANKHLGKTYKVPKYGMVETPTFKIGTYEDCAWSEKLNGGSGVWTKGQRVEVSKLQENYFPEVFIAGYVVPGTGSPNFILSGSDLDPKKVKPSLSGYYCILTIHKRDKEKLDTGVRVSGFDYNDLIAVDPNWKKYFEGLINLAKLDINEKNFYV
jgi:hypothetical protein